MHGCMIIKMLQKSDRTLLPGSYSVALHNKELSRYGGLAYFKHSPLSGTSEYIPEYIVTVHDGTDLNKCVNEELNTKIFPAQKSRN